MDDRTHAILETALREYIRTGRPITSESLYAAHDFGIKPAMIRWELNDLAEAGYFYQTRPSGGRLPTNKAYRFLVNELLADERALASADAETLAAAFLRGRRQAFVEGFSACLKVLGVGYEAPQESFYESGLPELLTGLDIESKDELLDIVRDFEQLPKRLAERESWWQGGAAGPQVWIGASPLTRSDRLSVITGLLGEGDNQFLLVAVGPKRMDYKKSLAVFKTLHQSVGKGKKTAKPKKRKSHE